MKINHKLNEKPYDYLLIIIREKNLHRSDDLIADMKGAFDAYFALYLLIG